MKPSASGAVAAAGRREPARSACDAGRRITPHGRPGAENAARRLWRASVAALLTLSGVIPAAAQTSVSVTTHPPRMHGWWMGDVLTQRVEIAAPEGLAPDPASLPQPRAVDYWLDLRAVTVAEQPGGYALTLEWQTFYSPLEPSLREVPATPLRLIGPDGPVDAVIPGFSFVTAPIRPILAPSSPEELRPDAAFVGVDARPDGRAAAGWGLAALAGLAGLAWHQAWPPFHRRPARPFTEAARRIRRLAEGGAPAPALCLPLHQGLDVAYGGSLLGADLDRFVARRPEFAPLRARLEAFFELSYGAFFSGDRARADAPGSILSLSADLAAIERGRR